MKASIRAFKTSLAKQADAISAFIEDLDAISFPMAALSPDDWCLHSVEVSSGDIDALNLAGYVCMLRASAVDYRDQIAEAARGKTYAQIEPKWIMADEARAQRYANSLRKALGLPALPKSRWISHPYKAGRF